MSTRKFCIAGNWKMFHTSGESVQYMEELTKHFASKKITGSPASQSLEIVLFPPFTNIATMMPQAQKLAVHLGGQNIHESLEGAYTGEIAGAMLADLQCTYVIIGHSERRKYFNETEPLLVQKVRMALANGLIPVYCVGESEEERNAGQAYDVVEKQVREVVSPVLEKISFEGIHKIIIAYEPLWAIGTGKNATSEDAEEMASHIRKVVENIGGSNIAQSLQILYGGSVKPSNAESLLQEKDIDGALIGGASLDPESFANIVKIAMDVAVQEKG